jgi:drug/metabolite transporter (DMT)-like permease
METALPLERRTATAHAALLAVVVVWAGAFSVIKALIDHGFAAEDIALLRYLIAAPGFAFLLVRVGGLPGLIALSPALTLLLAVGLGLERWSLRRAAGIAVAFVGVAIVVLLGAGGELSFANAKGPLIVVAAPVSFALYNVLLKPLLSRYDLLALTAATSLVGTVFLLPFLNGGTVDSVTGVSLGDALLVLYLGIGSTLLGYIGWNTGLRGLGATRAVTYTLLISPLAVLFGAVLLDETVTLWLALGGVLLVGGVAAAQRAKS